MKEIKEKPEILKKLQDEESSYNYAEIKKMQRHIGVMLENEDEKWKQRAKRNWYAMEDKNTKFFHACANKRRRKNNIKHVVMSKGGFLKAMMRLMELLEVILRSYLPQLSQAQQIWKIVCNIWSLKSQEK